MDSSGVYYLGEAAMKRVAYGLLIVAGLGGLVGAAITYRPSKTTTPTTVEARPAATCVWIREAHQATPENGVPPNVKYNCWSSLDGAWQGYVEEQQNGDWYNAHVPDYKTDEHADKYDTYGTLAQAEAHVEQAWHAKVTQ